MFEIEEFKSAEIECEQNTKEHFGEFFDIIDEVLIFYANILPLVTTDYHGSQKIPRYALLLLNLKNMRSLFSLSTLISKGNYVEANSILRSIYEMFLLNRCIMEEPEFAEKWLFEGQKMSHSQMLVKLKFSSNNGGKNDGEKLFWNFLCSFSHPDRLGSLTYVNFPGLEITKEGHVSVSIDIMPKFDKMQARYLLYYRFMFSFICMNDLFEYSKQFEHFKPDFEQKKKDLYGKVEEFLKKRKKEEIL
jgi:hypothetical protein